MDLRHRQGALVKRVPVVFIYFAASHAAINTGLPCLRGYITIPLDTPHTEDTALTH